MIWLWALLWIGIAISLGICGLGVFAHWSYQRRQRDFDIDRLD